MKTLFLFATLLFSVISAQAQNLEPKTCRIESFEQCFRFDANPLSANFRYPSRSFILFHNVPTGRAAVLVHGLTDSSFVMKDIAATLYRQGYDVYAVLLPGHGTRAEELFDVTKEQWLGEIRRAASIMATRSANGKILLGGFSMGGALITEEVLRKPEAYSGLLYFAPALRLADRTAGLSCYANYFTVWAADSQELENAPWRYNRLPMNAVCQLNRVIDAIKNRAGEIKIPVWSIVSTGDTRVDIPEVVDFVKRATNPKNISRVIYDKNITHVMLPLRTNAFTGRANPFYDSMETDLIHFLNQL